MKSLEREFGYYLHVFITNLTTINCVELKTIDKRGLFHIPIFNTFVAEAKFVAG
jgi:hypothetical protein